MASTTRIEDAQAQIARLREQVEALTRDRISPAMAGLAGRAEDAVTSATGVVRDQSQAVAGRVRDQPLIAILLAATAGWVIGRLMR